MTTRRQVWLTDIERDLVRGALEVLRAGIAPPGHGLDTKATMFARSFTVRRIDEVRKLFLDVGDLDG